MDFVAAARDARASLRSGADWPITIRERFGATVHPRSIERALARSKKNGGERDGDHGAAAGADDRAVAVYEQLRRHMHERRTAPSGLRTGCFSGAGMAAWMRRGRRRRRRAAPVPAPQRSDERPRWPRTTCTPASCGYGHSGGVRQEAGVDEYRSAPESHCPPPRSATPISTSGSPRCGRCSRTPRARSGSMRCASAPWRWAGPLEQIIVID